MANALKNKTQDIHSPRLEQQVHIPLFSGGANFLTFKNKKTIYDRV